MKVRCVDRYYFWLGSVGKLGKKCLASLSADEEDPVDGGKEENTKSVHLLSKFLVKVGTG